MKIEITCHKASKIPFKNYKICLNRTSNCKVTKNLPAIIALKPILANVPARVGASELKSNA
jgi:hypothetical protein